MSRVSYLRRPWEGARRWPLMPRSSCRSTTSARVKSTRLADAPTTRRSRNFITPAARPLLPLLALTLAPACGGRGEGERLLLTAAPTPHPPLTLIIRLLPSPAPGHANCSQVICVLVGGRLLKQKRITSDSGFRLFLWIQVSCCCYFCSHPRADRICLLQRNSFLSRKSWVSSFLRLIRFKARQPMLHIREKY